MTKEERREYARAWREKNKERINEAQRLRYANDEEYRNKMKDNNKDYRDNNADKIKKYQKSNEEKIKKYNADYYVNKTVNKRKTKKIENKK